MYAWHYHQARTNNLVLSQNNSWVEWCIGDVEDGELFFGSQSVISMFFLPAPGMGRKDARVYSNQLVN